MQALPGKRAHCKGRRARSHANPLGSAEARSTAANDSTEIPPSHQVLDVGGQFYAASFGYSRSVPGTLTGSTIPKRSSICSDTSRAARPGKIPMQGRFREPRPVKGSDGGRGRRGVATPVSRRAASRANSVLVSLRASLRSGCPWLGVIDSARRRSSKYPAPPSNWRQTSAYHGW